MALTSFFSEDRGLQEFPSTPPRPALDRRGPRQGARGRSRLARTSVADPAAGCWPPHPLPGDGPGPDPPPSDTAGTFLSRAWVPGSSALPDHAREARRRVVVQLRRRHRRPLPAARDRPVAAGSPTSNRAPEAAVPERGAS